MPSDDHSKVDLVKKSENDARHEDCGAQNIDRAREKIWRKKDLLPVSKG